MADLTGLAPLPEAFTAALREADQLFEVGLLTLPEFERLFAKAKEAISGWACEGDMLEPFIVIAPDEWVIARSAEMDAEFEREQEDDG